MTVTNGSTGCTSTTSITISQDVSMPMASLVSSGTLTCTNTSVTLTASPSSRPTSLVREPPSLALPIRPW